MKLNEMPKIVVVAVAFVLGAAAAGVQAQETSRDSNQTDQTSAASMVARVKTALHSDPALYDKHIDVSMEKGKVVMSGFVLSADDMHKAVTAAGKAVGEKNVINKLTVKRSDEVNSDNANG